jgi:hypothetical protein
MDKISAQLPVSTTNHKTPPPDATLEIFDGLLGKLKEPVCFNVVIGTSWPNKAGKTETLNQPAKMNRTLLRTA